MYHKLERYMQAYETSYFHHRGRPVRCNDLCGRRFVEYRFLRRIVRKDAASRIQALFRGGRSRWYLMRSNFSPLATLVINRLNSIQDLRLLNTFKAHPETCHDSYEFREDSPFEEHYDVMYELYDDRGLDFDQTHNTRYDRECDEELTDLPTKMKASPESPTCVRQGPYGASRDEPAHELTIPSLMG